MGTFSRTAIFSALAIISMVAEAMHHHYPSTSPKDSGAAEHRSFEAKMAQGWPDSKSLWADIPSSQSFSIFKQGANSQPKASAEDSFNIPLPQNNYNNNVQRKRQAIPNFDDQADHFGGFGSPGKDFSSGSIPQFPANQYDYNVQYIDAPRPKKHTADPGSFLASSPISTESRFNRPDFEQFRPSDFASSGKAGFNGHHERPIRHSSYPATPYTSSPIIPTSAKEDFQPQFDFKPPASSLHGKSHSYTTFEAPKVSSNFFVDHSSSDFKRPPRSSSSPPASFYSSTPASSSSFKKAPQQQQFSSFSNIPDTRQDTTKYYSQNNAGANNNEGDEDNFEYLEDFEGRADYRNYANDEAEGSPDYPEYPFAHQQEEEGKIEDESYDRENKEETGKYEMKNFRKPIKPMKYEREQPIEVESYGNSFGGVETFKGGYDSEDDAQKGITRHGMNSRPRKYSSQTSAPESPMYMEDEPVEDYNGQGYYMPKENNSDFYREPEEPASREEEPQGVPEAYGRYRKETTTPKSPKSNKKPFHYRNYDKYF